MIPIDHQYLYDKLHFFDDAEYLYKHTPKRKRNMKKRGVNNRLTKCRQKHTIGT